MTDRRTFLALLAAAALTPLSASAFEEGPFASEAFAAAQTAGKPIVIHVAAEWCETCHAQRAVLEELEGEPAFAAYALYTVDYDTQKDVMRTFNASQRSTLIVFKGDEEVGRLVGDTSEESIRALLELGIS
jgi:thioredoxin 1